jgi:hypothetical protein
MTGPVRFQVVGAVLALVGVIWGWTGFYPSNLPWLLLLVFGGLGLYLVGVKLKDLENKR